MSGPTTRCHGFHDPRGYSSCGNVAIIVNCRDSPPCTSSNGASPSRSRAPFSSSRPRFSPAISIGSSVRHIIDPSRVRGSRAPIEYGGNPGSGVGSTWGTSVAQRTPARSAANPAATVRMSATTASGANSSISGCVSRAARTAAWYGLSPGVSGVGKTLYSGAGSKRIPSRSTSSRHLVHVCSRTSWPRSTSVLPRAIAGNACPGSPNAATRKRLGTGFILSEQRPRLGRLDDLGDGPQDPRAPLGGEVHRREHQRADSGVLVDRQPLLDVVSGAHQCRLVDQLGRQRRRGFVLLAGQVEVLHLLRRVLESIAGYELV